MHTIDADSDNEWRELLSQMEASFQKLFISQQGVQEIRKVVRSLERNEPILILMENNNGSFSTLFSPFHGNTLLPKSQSLLIENEQLHPKLKAFCRLSGKIEGITDMMSTYENEPSSEEKQRLLPLLKEFIANMPSREEFAYWIKESFSK